MVHHDDSITNPREFTSEDGVNTLSVQNGLHYRHQANRMWTYLSLAHPRSPFETAASLPRHAQQFPRREVLGAVSGQDEGAQHYRDQVVVEIILQQIEGLRWRYSRVEQIWGVKMLIKNVKWNIWNNIKSISALANVGSLCSMLHECKKWWTCRLIFN